MKKHLNTDGKDSHPTPAKRTTNSPSFQIVEQNKDNNIWHLKKQTISRDSFPIKKISYYHSNDDNINIDSTIPMSVDARSQLTNS